MTAEMQLATVPPKETALQVYSAENGLEPYLQIIRAEIDGFTPDVSTRKGREAIASIAYKVARSKTALDNVGKELVAELKEVPKKIDAERKRMRDLLESWQDEVRKPLTEWEAAEEARKAKHQAGIDQINMRLECRDLDAAELKSNIAWLEGMAIDASWEEFETEAARSKEKALSALRDALTVREKYEAEQAELAELRRKQAEQDQKDREERIAREAAEQAKREAETKAQAERDAAAQRERDLELQAERAQREKLEAQQRAEQAKRDAEEQAAAAERARIAAEQQAAQDKIDAERRQAEAVERAAAAERQRQADEQARIKAEADAREKDRAHKGAVLKAAKEAVMATGITEDQAREVIKLITAGGVPRVYISY